ncbi:hypothetical protein [Serratia sp. DD3]|uniref:hypothetical protein n=1 Tax=Serratia sp. DD3 TaxID=1410619 RepID=UPI0003C5232D|nr:hypothetical protein [Serratia sp. DD3]KEY60034.1 hypothetical protein SRDD_11440 [Serratia sp. DD3]
MSLMQIVTHLMLYRHPAASFCAGRDDAVGDVQDMMAVLPLSITHQDQCTAKAGE